MRLAPGQTLRHIPPEMIRTAILILALTGLPHALGSEKLDPSTVARRVVLEGSRHVRVTAEQFAQGAFNFDSPDAWLFISGMRPSEVIASHLKRMWVAYEPAFPDANLRITPYEDGTLVIPHGSTYPALTVYEGASLSGASMALRIHTPYNDKSLDGVKSGIRSFRLKRGYMATLASKADGTGISRNYVAQDQDIEVRSLPADLAGEVRFIRVFPWRWTSKKGIAGNLVDKLNVAWYYDWNIGGKTTPDVEYVPIRQNRWWPGLNQDWKRKGSIHLLGHNEPDRPDQANMKVDEAIAAWPELMKTGLRLGSPAVSDGGLSWLYEFMEKADAAKLRVDFVAVHYYRAVNDPGDARGAASQMKNFLEAIHKRTKRPIWITEWNNGANWTKAPDPDAKEQRKAIEAMTEMLDKADFVERYAPYNWVEPCRELQRKDGSLTPAGEAYRELKSPVGYRQVKP